MAVFLTRLAIAFAALLIASVAFIGAVAFLCYAAFLGLALFMPPPVAAIMTAVLLILFAVIILLLGRGLIGARRRRRADRVPNAGIDAIETLLGLDLAELATKNPYKTTGVAFLIGLLFGVSPGLRRAAADLLRR
jgi:hypothetical protein